MKSEFEHKLAQALFVCYFVLSIQCCHFPLMETIESEDMKAKLENGPM